MAKDFFSEDEKVKIVEAIQEAEKNTSGEVRLHVENLCKGAVLDRATEVFAALKMHKTALRNGVLFYLAVKDHKFAILGDAGINAVVPSDFWDQIKNEMKGKFAENLFCDGVCLGIKAAGMQLKSHFPYQLDDINELPDDISFGKN
jgi:uncharacterized membrane protein